MSSHANQESRSTIHASRHVAWRATALGLPALLLGVACNSSSDPHGEIRSEIEAEPEQDTEEHAAPTVESQPVSLVGWNSEVIELPPDFAPELPTGVESLRFAPGMFDASAADYWSYAFVLWIDEPTPDAARIEALLELYYDGLLMLVADSKDRDIGDDPAQVEVEDTGAGRFEAKIDLIDSFVTFEAIDLRLLVETVSESETRSIVRCQASPQSAGHEVWLSLSAALASIEKP